MTGDYDGIVCSAVLMHVPEDDLAEAVRAIRRVVREGGRVLVSLPIPGDAVAPSRRDDDGRLFSGFDAERCVAMLAGEGFRLVERWDDADGLGRGGRRWVTMLLTKDGEAPWMAIGPAAATGPAPG
jgi:SAM-dependent methyltransferase